VPALSFLLWLNIELLSSRTNVRIMTLEFYDTFDKMLNKMLFKRF